MANGRIKPSRYSKEIAEGMNADAYITRLEQTIANIEASQQLINFPEPIGIVVDYVSSREGSAGGRLAMRNEGGQIFIAQGINGTISGFTPNFGEAPGLAELAADPSLLFRAGQSQRLPLQPGTLPNGLQWFAPSNPSNAPDGDIDLAGARQPGGLNLAAILGLIAAGYFALRG